MRSIRNSIWLSNLFYYLIMLLLVSGCASVYSASLYGGTVVPKGYKMQKVIVSYRTEGTVPE